MTRKSRKYTLCLFVKVAVDYTEETFGRLVTLGPIFRTLNRKDNVTYQVCACECGTIDVFRRFGLQSGNTKSCGCLHLEDMVNRQTKHGMSKTPEYCAWNSLRSRCYTKHNPKYPDYGGRGIRVCARWLEPNGQGFLNFLADMGKRPSKRHSIERKGNNGDYEPGNCEWATKEKQANNTRRNAYVEWKGRTQSLSDWARETGIPVTALYGRKNLGWSIDKMLTTPVNNHKKGQA